MSAANQYPRILLSQWYKGRVVYVGKIYLEKGQTHKDAIATLKAANPKTRIEEGGIDMTGAMCVTIF